MYDYVFVFDIHEVEPRGKSEKFVLVSNTYILCYGQIYNDVWKWLMILLPFLLSFCGGYFCQRFKYI